MITCLSIDLQHYICKILVIVSRRAPHALANDSKVSKVLFLPWTYDTIKRELSNTSDRYPLSKKYIVIELNHRFHNSSCLEVNKEGRVVRQEVLIVSLQTSSRLEQQEGLADTEDSLQIYQMVPQQAVQNEINVYR